MCLVCELCMCLARGGVGGESIRGLGLGFTNPVGTEGSVGRVSAFGLLGCGWCIWGVGGGLGQGLEWWGGDISV